MVCWCCSCQDPWGVSGGGGGDVSERLLPPEESELQLSVDTLVSELEERLLHVLITRCWSPPAPPPPPALPPLPPCTSRAADTRVVAVSRENTFTFRFRFRFRFGFRILYYLTSGEII